MKLRLVRTTAKAALLPSLSLAVVLAPALSGPAQAASITADNERISASRAGVRVEATVDWVNRTSFVLRNVVLKDTSCDGNEVYFHANIPGFSYPSHRNTSGCNTEARWSSLPGSSNGIYSLWLTACVDSLPDQCSAGSPSRNPYY